MEHIPKWRLYERFISSLESELAAENTTVTPNAKLIGSITGVQRQVDVLIDSRIKEDISRRVIIDAKFYNRKLNVKDVESFLGMMQDCRANRGILVCTKGYSSAALRRAQQAITTKVVAVEELDKISLNKWDYCDGQCKNSKSKTGWVLWDEFLGIYSINGPASVVAIAKCDECHDFNIWCWECGEQFAIIGNEGKNKCSCNRFWITSVEPEGTGNLGQDLCSVVLTVVLLNPPGLHFSLCRRPLN